MRKKTQLYILVILLISAFTGLILSTNGNLIERNENSIKTSNGYGIYWVEAGETGDGSSETTPAGNITYILDTYDIEDKIIKVKEGIYNTSIETFPLEIDKENVTIEAVGTKSNTIIDSDGGGQNIGAGDQYKGFLITNHSVTIGGFTFTDCSVPIYIHGGIIHLDDIHIENNLITENSYGIYAQNMNNSVIKDNILDNAVVQYVIMISSGFSNKITNNTVTESDDYGIDIAGGAGNILENNNVSNNPKIGIRIRSASMNNIIKNNTINNNGYEGILIETNSDNNTIMNNKIKGNADEALNSGTFFAIEIYNSDNTSIINNNITNTYDEYAFTNNEGGIYSYNADNTIIYLNNISNNDGNGIDVENSINTNITLNVIKNNGEYNNREIILLNVNETIIDRNIIEANKRNTIELDDCISNTILRNNLTNGPNFQIKGDLNSSDNYIYKNNFYSDLGCEFYDNNYLNSSVIGNYWSGFPGTATDSNGDHIRDYPVQGQDIYDYMPAMEPIDIMDTTDPTITITDPSDDDVVCSNFTVEWNADDEEEILFYALYLENYGWNFTDDLNEWTYSDVDNGSHTIEIYVVDKGWNYALDTVSIIVDKAPVSVIIESPMVQDYDLDGIDINVTIHGILSPIDTVIAYLNGGEGIKLTHYSGNIWNYSDYYFSDGIHTIDIFANDTCGNVNDTESVIFKVDTAGPLITLESPVNHTYHSSFIDINATVTDDTSTISTVIARIDETDNVPLPNKVGDLYYLLDREFSDGLHTIRIFAYDTVGNVNYTEIVYFTVDTDTINVTINNPLTTMTYTSLSVLINATVECETIIDTVLAEINGIQNITLDQDGEIWSKLHSFLEGANTVRIYANDTYGNDAKSAPINFDIDTLAPIWNPTPVNQNYEVGDDVSYDCNATDPSGVSYSLNDTTYFNIDSSSGVITNSTVLTEGVYWIEIIAEDPFGHSINATIKITVEEATVTPPPGGGIPGFSVFLLYSIIGVSVLAIIFKRTQI